MICAVFRKWLFVVGLWYVAGSALANSGAAGIYAIWYQGHDNILTLPYVVGGQVFAQWKDIERKEGVYDFSIIDRQLRAIDEKGLHATVQINGNLHPDYLYTKVPFLPVRIGGAQDARGTLMYWHNNYKDAYTDLLRAYAQHLKDSPYRALILGVRLNYNAIGTEQFHIRGMYRNASIWSRSAGTVSGVNWNLHVGQEYKKYILRTFIDLFSPELKVFVRNDIFAHDQVFVDDESSPLYSRDQRSKQHYTELLKKGGLYLFHTSSEIQPRNSQWGAQRYMSLRKYCRTGQTECYAESWTDADRRYSKYPSVDNMSRRQWLYWRLLSDLNMGISYIGVYYSDLKSAKNTEIATALEFAARYAGYHAKPAHSPGAWIAFREGDFLKGDYTFLMERLPGDRSKPLSSIGPSDQRFGVWARMVNEDDNIRLSVSEDFVRSVLGGNVKLRIVYFDKGSGDFDVSAFGRHRIVRLSGSGRWKEVHFSIPVMSGTDVSPLQRIELTATKGDVILHMLEVLRG